MGFLSTLPRGSVLSPIVESSDEAQQAIKSVGAGLYDSLTGPQREVFDAGARFKMLCSGPVSYTHLTLPTIYSV